MGLCLDLKSTLMCGRSPVWASSSRCGIGDINADGEIQVKDPGLGLGFSVRKGLCRKYGYGQN